MTAPDSGREWEEEVCGETYDHDEQITYEDAEGIQWICNRCGAEGWEELTDDTTEATR